MIRAVSRKWQQCHMITTRTRTTTTITTTSNITRKPMTNNMLDTARLAFSSHQHQQLYPYSSFVSSHDFHYHHDNQFYREQDPDHTQEDKLSFIILNTAYCNHPLFTQLYQLSHTIICADGGANQLYDLYHHQQQQQQQQPQLRMPDFVCGDLDSARPGVLQYYADRQVKILKFPDQNYNDLQKALHFLMKKEAEEYLIHRHHLVSQSPPSSLNQNDDHDRQSTSSTTRKHKQQRSIKHTILIYGGGGRLDQEMCNLNALYQITKEQYIVQQQQKLLSEQERRPVFEEYRLLMISPYTCATILRPGVHTIRRNLEFEKKKCALIPLGGPVWNLRTSGLKWNIDHHHLDQTTTNNGTPQECCATAAGNNGGSSPGDTSADCNYKSTVEPAMQFGGLVSTSNEFDHNNHVIVDTSDMLLWNWTIKPLLPSSHPLTSSSSSSLSSSS